MKIDTEHEHLISAGLERPFHIPKWVDGLCKLISLSEELERKIENDRRKNEK